MPNSDEKLLDDIIELLDDNNHVEFVTKYNVIRTLKDLFIELDSSMEKIDSLEETILEYKDKICELEEIVSDLESELGFDNN